MSTRLPLLYLVQFSNLIEQLNGFCRICNPRRRAREACLEVICSSGQKLVPNVECFASFNATEETLAGQYAP
jgi:hypothetical protein